MKRLALLIAPFALISLLVLAGCGKSAGTSTSQNGGGVPPNTIQMNSNDFTAHAVTVQANQPVTLDDTVSGGALHILCVGTGNGGSNTCDTTDKVGGAPKDFIGQGMQVQAGSKNTVTFTKAGTYHVICTLHGGMFIDVTVQ